MARMGPVVLPGGDLGLPLVGESAGGDFTMRHGDTDAPGPYRQ